MNADPLTVLILLGFALLLIGGLTYGANSSERRRREAARQYAVGQGVLVEEVERDTIWTRGIRTGRGLRTFTVARYSLKSPNPNTAPWSFLQRWKEAGNSRFPRPWQLQFEGAEPSPPQLKALDEIALDQQWAEEFLELESRPDRISVYWSETGIEGAHKVVGYLRRLGG